MPTSPGFRGLRVYQLTFKLAMEISTNQHRHFIASPTKAVNALS